MNKELIQKLQYSYAGQHDEAYSLPLPLKDSLQLISNFFAFNTNNKLCLVFPSKEFAAQWLSIPTVLFLIENDFAHFKGEIFESYRQNKQGEKLILNNIAIVEWVGIKSNGVSFKTKGTKDSSGAEITIRFSDVIMLQKAPPSRKVLSSLKTVKEALPSRNITPTEKLLNIDTYGNKEFIKNKICLVSKFKTYDDSIEEITMNHASLPEYFQEGKIDENGAADINSPLLISNNLSTLALYVTLSATSVAKIIIDGFVAIQERGTDFSDIDVKGIPTVLITDLSEIESFETIGNFGFDFFNFTKENLQIDKKANLSPFHSFDKKLNKYLSFNLVKEICHNTELETTTIKIHSIEKDESNNNLTSLKISLIQLTNLVSRISHIPTAEEISVFNTKINSIENLFLRCRMWLGDSHKPIEESISLLKSVIENFSSSPSEKCARLKALMNAKQYDYIICPTEEEANTLDNSLPKSTYTDRPKVISVADVNDSLLSSKPIKGILTGWAKSNNINRILSSFLFSELTVLFYQFENKYYNSLLRRNRQYSENIKATINSKGIRSEDESGKPKSFSELYLGDEVISTTSESSFDILDFEIKLDNTQYSKYIAKGSLIDSIKAKRIVFESDFFIYTTESHKFLVINEFIEKHGVKANLHRRKVEALQTGDVIALINTDRDILVDLVEKNTNTKELASVKQWTELWKNLLKEYYASIRNDFKRLVEDLRKNDCKKHEVTIRTWLQDESRIGPDDNADLISIALLTNSNLLNDNINTVREAIRKMTGWRMKASDFITDKIKAQIHEFADSSIINKKILVEGLGSVIVLKVIEVSNVWENIDVKYVNRLLQKENI
ncbi:DrmE family protein [Sediminibacterium sp.]|uniref:DrmE family protein n=1 Tax=Sediminibacterium sp. TaxID=1917865 RepID=UPI0025E91ACB|nr:DrmE family protein [Sediminibacterium sp.]